jgi:extracellular elastinolytic metalloproteinase
MNNRVPGNFHALYDRGCRAARGALPTPSAQMETAGHERLTADVPDLMVDYDEATRLPNRVVSRRPSARLAAPSADSPEDAVVHFIQDRGDLWNLAPEDAGTVEVVSGMGIDAVPPPSSSTSLAGVVESFSTL